MLATKRADGSFVLGDAHGDFVELDDLKPGWAVSEGYSDEEWKRERDRIRQRKLRAKKPLAKRVCKVCESEYMPTRHDQNRCKKCVKREPKMTWQDQRTKEGRR